MFLIILDRDIRGTTYAFFVHAFCLRRSFSLSSLTFLSLSPSPFYVFIHCTIVSIESCDIGNKFYRAQGSPAARQKSSRGRIGVGKVSNSREAWTARHVARPFTEQLACVRDATNPSSFRDFNDSARSLDVVQLPVPDEMMKIQMKYSPTYELPWSPFCLCCPTSAILCCV